MKFDLVILDFSPLKNQHVPEQVVAFIKHSVSTNTALGKTNDVVQLIKFKPEVKKTCLDHQQGQGK